MNKCADIDECRGYTAVCDRNAWCTNTIGSYQCECMAAYRGDGSHCTFVGLGRSSLDCRDCSPNATCENGICQCKPGFEGDGFNCTDVNECFRMPYACDKNAECLNREGSYICSCLPGYAGNGYNCTKTKIANNFGTTDAMEDHVISSLIWKHVSKCVRLQTFWLELAIGSNGTILIILR
ncbi:hypothetical protein KIN20_016069 [Parelaphostrongylus tenuis]|uniref:EGF-like domain-containing protein n=1 Tax=Parelaphostrongylus tenuis TaxID=148309 RepID=A0AAD5QPG5_PARTN|nr:hypothetical protein KIN20_016069 [Parelaphostrongylus tenuis]